MLTKRFHHLLFISLLLCTNLAFSQADVSVRVEVETAKASVDELVFATVFITNEGDAFRNNLQVSLRFSQDLAFKELSTQNVNFHDTRFIWSVDQLVIGETDSIRVVLQPLNGGVHTLTAELTSADMVDWDSFPGNDRSTEDDQDDACISVPVAVDCGQSLVLRAPRNQSTYAWYRNDVLLANSTSDTIHPLRSGSYRFEVGGNTCTTGNCCPVIVDRGACDHDLALVASASDITQSSAFQTITLTLHNQGTGTVDAVSIYVTTSLFMRLKPETKGWQLSGSRMTNEWRGSLKPGESTEIQFEIQAISGGEAADYQMFAEIFEFYAGGSLLSDVDSDPDVDPTNDKIVNDAYQLPSAEDEDDSDIVALTDCPVITVSGNREVCVGETIALTANTNVSDVSYSWSGAAILSCTTCANPSLLVTEDVDLTLETSTPDGCFQSQVIQVRTTNCANDILLIAGLNDPDQACFPIAPGAELQFCNPGQIPAGIQLTDSYEAGQGCVTAQTDGTWAGGFEACLEVCLGGDCQSVGLRVISKPKSDVINAVSGELICISDLLQMNQAALDMQIQGGANGLQLISAGNDCFTLQEPSSSYPTTEFQLIHTYTVYGETIFDTTTVIIPERTVCDFEVFTEESFTIEADVITQETGADQAICIEGNLGELLSANYSIGGKSIDRPTQGCEAFQVAKYSLRGLPLRWNDNGWNIISYSNGSGASITNVYAATMDEVVAKLSDLDFSSNVSFTASQLLLEIQEYSSSPGSLELVHLESNTRLSMQPLIVTGYSSWALQIPEGLGIGEYEITATNDDGCLDIATLIVIEPSDKTVIRDTVYASVEVNEPYVVCGMDGYVAASSDWTNLTADCYTYTPKRVGFGGYYAFAKTEGSVITEYIYALTVTDRTCAPMMVAERVSVTSNRCRSEYLDLGLTRPDISVTSSSGRIISASQVTGTRAGVQYDLTVLPEVGLTSSYRIANWDGLPQAVGTEGNLQSIFQQLREAGLDVDIVWSTNTLSAAGQGISNLTLTNLVSGQPITLSPSATQLNTYGRFYGRTGKNTIDLSLNSCRDQMIGEVECQIVVWNGGLIFLTGGPGSGTSIAMSQIELPDNMTSVEIWQSPESLDARLSDDSSSINFKVLSEAFIEGQLLLHLRDVEGVMYEVTVDLKTQNAPCLAEIWREEGYELVANPHTGMATFFLPESFDRDQTTVIVNGTRRRGGFVKRNQVIEQTYSTTGAFTQVAIPSGKTVDVKESLSEAIEAVLAKAEVEYSTDEINLKLLEGETRLFAHAKNDMWQELEPLKQRVELRYAMLLEPGTYDIEVRSSVRGSECADKISVVVKSSIVNFFEDAYSLDVGANQEWCLPEAATENVVVSMENICRDESGEIVSIDWDERSNCLKLQANEEGVEYACIKRTYLNGSVDSIELTLTVRRESRLALAPDHHEIGLGQFDIIEVLANDEIGSEPLQLSLISEPFFGRANVIGNSAIEYLHDGRACEKDVFTYEVCQGAVCDSTIVELDVSCVELLVYNGISPNGDGVNDEFTVMGLGQYPEHEITIYNRSGNMLISFTDYQNDWNGEVDGDQLPAGTYFYTIDLGEGEFESGYIQLSR